MDQLRIIGGTPLKGSIRISGAKNAMLPLMTASLLTDEPLTLTNVPQLADVTSMEQLLAQLGVDIKMSPQQMTLNANTITSTEAPYELVRKMRASILVLCPLVARCGQAKVSLPGGCAIGTRPVDLHIKGLEALGAQIEITDGYVIVKAPKGLQGADFSFTTVSVTGTENLLMAAVFAKGRTRLLNAACEPEVTNLAECLNAMGAKISGIGTNTLVIEGVERLHGTTHRVLPDRIETATYAVAAAITGGELDLLGTTMDLLPSVTTTLEAIGVELTPIPDGFHVKASLKRPRSINVTTQPYPGFATDVQAQMMALLTLADGESKVTETIFENRFMHVPELSRMGADITINGSCATVRGVKCLKGAPVMATDLRASVSLVLAGLAAQGETIVSRIYHLDRGYENLEAKLAACGAHIERLAEKPLDSALEVVS